MGLVQNLISKTSSRVSKVHTDACRVHASEELEGFRKAQRLAYQCAIDISKELKEGWTETQAADLMDSYLRDYGVRSFFHKSFAWFGDRTRFQGFTSNRHFMPSKTRYRGEEVVILDTAPILAGYVADIGYTFSHVPNAELDRAKEKLRFFRRMIPEWFSLSLTPAQIWKKVDEELTRSGYVNCHAMYPFSVLGHRVHQVPLSHVTGVTIPFGLHAYWSLLSRGLFPELLSADHQGEKTGLWAVEPHFGGLGFGAKFEEILVVEPGRAYWLDDQVPHAG